jgi:ectoine hydroxylase
MTEDPYPTRTSGQPSLIGRVDPVTYGTGANGPLSGVDPARFAATGFHAFDQLIDPSEVAIFGTGLRRLSEDSALRADERTVFEPKSEEVRSIFEVHKVSSAASR